MKPIAVALSLLLSCTHSVSAETILLYTAGRNADHDSIAHFESALARYADAAGKDQLEVIRVGEGFPERNDSEALAQYLSDLQGDIDALVMIETWADPLESLKETMAYQGIEDLPVLRIAGGPSPDHAETDRAFLIAVPSAVSDAYWAALDPKLQERFQFSGTCKPPFGSFMASDSEAFDICWYDSDWVASVVDTDGKPVEDFVSILADEAARLLTECLSDGDLGRCDGNGSLWGSVPFDAITRSWTIQPKVRVNWDLFKEGPHALGLSQDRDESPLDYMNRVLCPGCSGSGDICGDSCPSECKNTCTRQGNKECCAADGMVWPE